MDVRLHQLLSEELGKLQSALAKAKLLEQVSIPVLFEELIYRKTPTIIVYDMVMLHYRGGSRPWQVDVIGHNAEQLDQETDQSHVRHIHIRGLYDSGTDAIDAALQVIREGLGLKHRRK